MKKKFWTTFLISFVVFSTIFAIIGHRMLNMDSMASQEENDYDLEAEKIIEEKGEILFLLMGIDDQDGSGGVESVKAKKIEGENRHRPTGKRTDTMILCKYNFDTGDTTMLFIPRDSRVSIGGRKSMEKINHAHSYGGPYLAIKTVKDFLNVDLEYYVTVDYLAVKEIVNAIGGVEIDIAERMYYRDPADKPPLIIDFQPGLQTLDGEDAIKFLRYRPKDLGDLGRVENQKLFMKELIKQTLRPRNIIKLPKLIKTYYDYVDTNIPLSLVLKGVGTVNKVDFENINTHVLPGEGKYIGGTSYFIPHEEATRKLMEELFGNFVLD